MVQCHQKFKKKKGDQSFLGSYTQTNGSGKKLNTGW